MRGEGRTTVGRDGRRPHLLAGRGPPGVASRWRRAGGAPPGGPPPASRARPGPGRRAAACAAAGPGGGTLVRFQMNAPSLGEDKRNVRVYLPRSYDTPAAAERAYPTGYRLPGWPGAA